MLTLYHLAVSHFSEKARWALDLKGLDYRSRLLTPGYHILTVGRVARSRTVPVLLDSESGATVADSTEVLHYLDRLRPEPCLFPADTALADRVAAIEDYCDQEIGPSVSGFLYSLVVDRPDVIRSSWSQARPAGSRLLLRASMPLLLLGLRRTRGVGPDTAPRYRERFFAALDRLRGWLEESGGGFLAGDRFSAADLTAAVLLGPAVRPPGSPWDPATFTNPPLPSMPGEVDAFHAEVARHPVSKWALGVWGGYRGARRHF